MHTTYKRFTKLTNEDEEKGVKKQFVIIENKNYNSFIAYTLT